MSETRIRLLRKNGRGLEGTYENIRHHARPMKAYVDILAPVIPTLGFKDWAQGHNVHTFVTDDGREYTLRPIYQGKYIGIEFAMNRPIRVVIDQWIDLSEAEQFINVLRRAARPQQPNARRHRPE
jgi:hypothetical protein